MRINEILLNHGTDVALYSFSANVGIHLPLKHVSAEKGKLEPGHRKPQNSKEMPQRTAVQQTREHEAPRRKSTGALAGHHKGRGWCGAMGTEKQGVGKEGGDDELN